MYLMILKWALNRKRRITENSICKGKRRNVNKTLDLANKELIFEEKSKLINSNIRSSNIAISVSHNPDDYLNFINLLDNGTTTRSIILHNTIPSTTEHENNVCEIDSTSHCVIDGDNSSDISNQRRSFDKLNWNRLFIFFRFS